jgi:hypothetical protein
MVAELAPERHAPWHDGPPSTRDPDGNRVADGAGGELGCWLSERMTLHRVQRLIRTLATSSGEELRFTARAAMLAPWLEASLGALGLQRTLDLLERMTPLGARLHPLEGQRAALAVERAFRGQPWLPGKCLVRALVQYGLHRRDGVRATLHVGVRRGGNREVEAHAWVEPPALESDAGYESILTRSPV